MKDTLRTIGAWAGYLFLIALWIGPPIAIVCAIFHFIRKFW